MMFEDVFTSFAGNRSISNPQTLSNDLLRTTDTFDEFSTSSPFTFARAVLNCIVISDDCPTYRPVSECPFTIQNSIMPCEQCTGNIPYSPLFVAETCEMVKLSTPVRMIPFSSKF